MVLSVAKGEFEFNLVANLRNFAKILGCLKTILGIERLHMTSHISRQKKWLIKTCNLCWKAIARTQTFGFIFKINEKFIKNWNEILLVGSLETNKFDQKQFG